MSNDYAKKTKTELIQLCDEQKIRGVSGKSKQYLVNLLEGGGNYISREEAEKSADEWMPVIREWLVKAILDPEQHRDIGKVLAQAAEIEGVKQLNQLSGKENKLVVGMPYDCLYEYNETKDEIEKEEEKEEKEKEREDTNDNEEKNRICKKTKCNQVRTQIKFRMGDWHFETTRRNSQKNMETNSTGHVAYRNDEFDLLAIFTPSKTFGITGSKLRCIPTAALIDKEKPHQLVTHIKANLRALYDNEEKTAEVIRQIYSPELYSSLDG